MDIVRASRSLIIAPVGDDPNSGLSRSIPEALSVLNAQLMCCYHLCWELNTFLESVPLGSISIQETERLVADPAPGITAEPHDDNLRYFDVTIEGPGGSPFESKLGSFI